MCSRCSLLNQKKNFFIRLIPETNRRQCSYLYSEGGWFAEEEGRLLDGGLVECRHPAIGIDLNRCFTRHQALVVFIGYV